MDTRSGDTGAITFDRKIPLWGILLIAGGLVGQGVLLWASSREQAIESRYMAASITDLTSEVKRIGSQISEKSNKDADQDRDIKDVSRRVAELERTRLK